MACLEEFIESLPKKYDTVKNKDSQMRSITIFKKQLKEVIIRKK